MGAIKCGKGGTQLVAVADRSGHPLALHAASASPHEITLVQDTLAQRHVAAQPARLIGDRAYDSDRLDAELAVQGIELISAYLAGPASSWIGPGQIRGGP